MCRQRRSHGAGIVLRPQLLIAAIFFTLPSTVTASEDPSTPRADQTSPDGVAWWCLAAAAALGAICLCRFLLARSSSSAEREPLLPQEDEEAGSVRSTHAHAPAYEPQGGDTLPESEHGVYMGESGESEEDADEEEEEDDYYSLPGHPDDPNNFWRTCLHFARERNAEGTGLDFECAVMLTLGILQMMDKFSGGDVINYATRPYYNLEKLLGKGIEEFCGSGSPSKAGLLEFVCVECNVSLYLDTVSKNEERKVFGINCGPGRVASFWVICKWDRGVGMMHVFVETLERLEPMNWKVGSMDLNIELGAKHVKKPRLDGAAVVVGPTLPIPVPVTSSEVAETIEPHLRSTLIVDRKKAGAKNMYRPHVAGSVRTVKNFVKAYGAEGSLYEKSKAIALIGQGILSFVATTEARWFEMAYGRLPHASNPEKFSEVPLNCWSRILTFGTSYLQDVCIWAFCIIKRDSINLIDVDLKVALDESTPKSVIHSSPPVKLVAYLVEVGILVQDPKNFSIGVGPKFENDYKKPKIYLVEFLDMSIEFAIIHALVPPNILKPSCGQGVRRFAGVLGALRDIRKVYGDELPSFERVKGALKLRALFPVGDAAYFAQQRGMEEALLFFYKAVDEGLDECEIQLIHPETGIELGWEGVEGLQHIRHSSGVEQAFFLNSGTVGGVFLTAARLCLGLTAGDTRVQFRHTTTVEPAWWPTSMCANHFTKHNAKGDVDNQIILGITMMIRWRWEGALCIAQKTLPTPP